MRYIGMIALAHSKLFRFFTTEMKSVECPEEKIKWSTTEPINMERHNETQA